MHAELSADDGNPRQLIVEQERFVKVPFIIQQSKGNMHLQMKAFLRFCVEGTRLENKFINFGVRSG